MLQRDGYRDPYRDHPKEILARLPAQEIENAVKDAIFKKFKTIENLADLFGMDVEKARRNLEYISSKYKTLDVAVEKFITKVSVGTDVLKIQINLLSLENIIKGNMNVDLELEKSKTIISQPYKTRRAKLGALIIEPADAQDPDVFDLPSGQFKAWIQGIIWREEHFNGMTLQAIADREGFSATHILKYVK
ncbi:MAG: hypothetical protein ACT4OY_03380 [Alphaproteobacteria bacterium]